MSHPAAKSPAGVRLCASCDRCRSRKTKCDGRRPCGHCAAKYQKTHGLTSIEGIDTAMFECMYSPARKRGPVPGAKTYPKALEPPPPQLRRKDSYPKKAPAPKRRRQDDPSIGVSLLSFDQMRRLLRRWHRDDPRAATEAARSVLGVDVIFEDSGGGAAAAASAAVAFSPRPEGTEKPAATMATVDRVGGSAAAPSGYTFVHTPSAARSD